MSASERRILIEACPSRALARFQGKTIAESDRALLLREDGYPPRIYFPRSEVKMSLSEESEHKTHCPFKGDAAYWSFNVDGDTLENVAWGYPDPMPSVRLIAGHISFAEPIEVKQTEA